VAPKPSLTRMISPLSIMLWMWVTAAGLMLAAILNA
jgi:hypothetical protein